MADPAKSAANPTPNPMSVDRLNGASLYTLSSAFTASTVRATSSPAKMVSTMGAARVVVQVTWTGGAGGYSGALVVKINEHPEHAKAALTTAQLGWRRWTGTARMLARAAAG